jgi:8-oxo-dGTP pyrophosphatase MutT (NUDIX family)
VLPDEFEDALESRISPYLRDAANVAALLTRIGRLSDANYWLAVLGTFRPMSMTLPFVDVWRALFNSPRPGRDAVFMEAEDRAALAAMPEVLTVYRGARDERFIQGMHWTLNPAIAEYFAWPKIRGPRDLHFRAAEKRIVRYLVKGEVRRDDVIFYYRVATDSPNLVEEHEVVVLPEAVEIVSVESRSAPNYVACERGHLHWGMRGAGVMLSFDNDGQERYLLTLRSAAVQHPHTWSCPGGAILAIEDALEGAIREAREEIGPLPEITFSRDSVLDHGGWTYQTFWGHVRDPFDVDPSDEVADCRWFTADEIDGLPLHPDFSDTWRAFREASQ